MNLHTDPFLGSDFACDDIEKSAVVIIPFPYEGGVSYGTGAAGAPYKILEASAYLEEYDEVLRSEPWKNGIATLGIPEIARDPEEVMRQIESLVTPVLQRNALPIILGGDHSITTGALRAMNAVYGEFSVLQLDAHADLRDEYENSRHSHACAMARARELTPHVAQLGVRSMSSAEAKLIRDNNYTVCTMHDYRSDKSSLDELIAFLPNPFYLTIDVDVLDWSVVSSTGTPEPGGFTWDEIIGILSEILNCRRVVGIDVVELAAMEGDNRSAFAVAKLIYKMIGYQFQNSV